MKFLTRNKFRARAALLALTQRQIAARVGCSEWQLCNMLAGRQPVGDQLARRLAQALDTNVDEITTAYVSAEAAK